MNHTSIEQSKKLLKLGLKPETADMYYRDWKRQTDSIRYAYNGTGGEDDLPSWSCEALLSVMPSNDGNTARYVNLEWYKEKDGTFFFTLEYNDSWGEVSHEITGDNLLEACYNMTIWLLKNHYIESVNDR